MKKQKLGQANQLSNPTPPNLVEDEVRETLQRGDRKATLTALMNAYGPALYRYCRQLTNDVGLAEDVHQMTFVQAYEGLSGFRYQSTFRTWLFSIARHRCLDAIKSQRRRQARFELVDEPPHRPDRSHPVDQRLETKDRIHALDSCLGALAPHVRDAVLLRFQQESSYAEMANISRERPATLQARVARALPVLRRCLESSGVTP